MRILCFFFGHKYTRAHVNSVDKATKEIIGIWFFCQRCLDTYMMEITNEPQD